MRLPTFSRQTGATRSADDEPTLVDTPAVGAHGRDTAPEAPAHRRTDQTAVNAPPVTTQRISTADSVNRPPAPRQPVARPEPPAAPPATPVVAGPRPRASLLATLGLLTGVASALLVLSGPLLGYGVGLAGLALLLSLGGISATGRRHVAGKSDAVIGLLLALGAIVVGVLALTGSLSWLGTDAETVTGFRNWLDARFIERF